jgi:hypothetical protein
LFMFSAIWKLLALDGCHRLQFGHRFDQAATPTVAAVAPWSWWGLGAGDRASRENRNIGQLAGFTRGRAEARRQQRQSHAQRRTPGANLRT